MNARMPTEKAHGYQIAKMCEALSLLGVDVSLVLPTRKNDLRGDIYSYYDVQNNFTIRYALGPDMLSVFHGNRIGYYLQSLSFLWALRNVVVPSDSIIVTRSPEVAWWYAHHKYRVYFDAHNFPERGLATFKFLLKNIVGVIANSEGTATAFRRNGFKKVLAAPNGVDLTHFESKDLASRESLGLPAGRIAMYVGHLYGWKGVDVVVRAAQQLEDRDLTFVFVGGTASDINRYCKKTKDLNNVVFLGHKSRDEIPSYIKSADVLLLPNVPTTQESLSYTSPIKMFEYMASGVPIVASDLPSIREVLNDTNAILVIPGSPDALLKGVALAFQKDAASRAHRAKEDVKKYTWSARAQRIVTFLS